MPYNLLSFRFQVYNPVSISALNPDMYYQKKNPHKEDKRLPRFACTEVINISEPLKLLNTSLFFCCFFLPIMKYLTLCILLCF